MTEKPELSDGYGRIAHEIMEVLSRTYLSSYESRFLWCLFRKTYGWNKKDDFLALSQVSTMTGMHPSHVSRAKRKLVARKIVTQTGNKIAFNKYHSQWLRLHEQAKVTQTGKSLHKQAKVAHLGSAQTGNNPPPKQAITPPPKQAGTIDSLTKDILQKQRPEKKATNERAPERKQLSDEEAERQFFDFAMSECGMDKPYRETKQSQLHELRTERREEVYRKMRVCLNAHKSDGVQTRKLAKKMYGEIVGMIQDRALDEKTIDSQSLAKRRKFAQQEIGGQNADAEVGDVGDDQVWDQ